MKNATSNIRQMRADVDRLAKADTQPDLSSGFVERIITLRDGSMSLRVRLRKLHLGERLRNGDLWLDSNDGTLRLLPSRWYRAFVGRVGPDSVDHYRIAP